MRAAWRARWRAAVASGRALAMGNVASTMGVTARSAGTDVALGGLRSGSWQSSLAAASQLSKADGVRWSGQCIPFMSGGHMVAAMVHGATAANTHTPANTASSPRRRGLCLVRNQCNIGRSIVRVRNIVLRQINRP